VNIQAGGLDIEQFICRDDNYGVVVHDPKSGGTAVIDAPEAQPIIDVLTRRGWTPSLLLVTHHHADHVEGNLALKERYGLTIVGPEKEAATIPGIDRTVKEGDRIAFAGGVEVIETPGHTLGHVTFVMPGEGVAFAADTLFALGCGRVIEGDFAMMQASLAKLAALPPETVVFVGHEYTAANARFALTVDPGNETLQRRAAEVLAKAARREMTLPTTIREELETNPFLRWDDPAIRSRLALKGSPAAEVFGEIRRLKDNFKG
jgi:hydroxyacylglutathione hydrolase